MTRSCGPISPFSIEYFANSVPQERRPTRRECRRAMLHHVRQGVAPNRAWADGDRRRRSIDGRRRTNGHIGRHNAVRKRRRRRCCGCLRIATGRDMMVVAWRHGLRISGCQNPGDGHRVRWRSFGESRSGGGGERGIGERSRVIIRLRWCVDWAGHHRDQAWRWNWFRRWIIRLM